MYGPTTVTTKGQVTLPQELRIALSVQAGDLALFESVDFENKTATVKIVSTQNIVKKLGGSMKTNKKYLDYNLVRQKAGYLLGKRYEKIAKEWKRS
ncbi:MAG: AbrB/MazE/SpoVT family DNA-binding domain-containing protein [Patescibacteria group bacterium]